MVEGNINILDTTSGSSQFSGDQVITIIMIIIWIVSDRMLYRLRPLVKYSKQVESASEEEFSYAKHSIFIKMIFHVILVISCHYYFCFKLPLESKQYFLENKNIVTAYLLICAYLYFSA